MKSLALVILLLLSPKDFTGLPRIRIPHFRFKSGEKMSLKFFHQNKSKVVKIQKRS